LYHIMARHSSSMQVSLLSNNPPSARPRARAWHAQAQGPVHFQSSSNDRPTALEGSRWEISEVLCLRCILPIPRWFDVGRMVVVG
jgi:hypothetical protein